ncbi:DUF6020 family protein [Bifidobacterium amazonense]|uniref:DUF6020 family protein n=1 Tax=Bifidobacterium amazonense TaxID=2809027 RepID=A0ABS9VYG2_9BIFI|nr:DUF6020 family protein [Bifidobacterium amazonense]MCH9277087.1 DUF6020 family protein [Bifidobacterium amazonense]
MTTASDSRSPASPAKRRAHGVTVARLGSVARWTLAVLACLWIALCVAIGPLYWAEGSIADWTQSNTLYFIATFLITLSIVGLLVRSGRPHGTSRSCEPPLWRTIATLVTQTIAERLSSTHPKLDRTLRTIATYLSSITRRAAAATGRGLTRITDRGWKISLILIVGWLWVPATLMSAFGADVRSQAREFSWAWNQWTGMKQPYIGFFSFVPMDIYPTAHYMWPSSPTYLTDQHNIVLTVLYGGAAAISRYLTDSNDAGFVALSALQWLFAAFCCASAANRFLNLPWLRPAHATERVDHARPERPPYLRQADFAHPERGVVPSLTITRLRPMAYPNRAAGGFARLVTLVMFLTCPLVLFSTISLTKSPLFAFAFAWWFGVWYELLMTWRPGGRNPLDAIVHTPKHTLAAFALSTCVMLISAKYAWYIIAAQIVLVAFADRKRWRTYAVALLLPVIVIHGGISLLGATGSIITGDPIESRGVQLQMIARVAKLNPDGIPESAREKLEPIFNLDQMAESYFRQDADPVKSSGIQSKKVSYKWRTVTPEDMQQFNAAWLEITKANPVIALDALLAECFGYFNPTDMPYVSMDYYVTSDYVQKSSTWLKLVNHDWRETVAQKARDWGSIPLLGWVTHGNFYVTLTLLIGAAEVVLRRWRTLLTHFPLLLLMGVMATAPANNFERHMLPVAFVFCFVCLTFWRESRAARADRAAADPGDPA